MHPLLRRCTVTGMAQQDMGDLMRQDEGQVILCPCLRGVAQIGQRARRQEDAAIGRRLAAEIRGRDHIDPHGRLWAGPAGGQPVQDLADIAGDRRGDDDAGLLQQEGMDHLFLRRRRGGGARGGAHGGQHGALVGHGAAREARLAPGQQQCGTGGDRPAMTSAHCRTGPKAR